MKDVTRFLSARMLMVAKCFECCDIAYDIGTDHCYIPIYLIQHNICKTAIATDVKKGPVERAMENIRLFDMEGVINTFVSDGISHVGNSADIIISGMGADAIIEILSNNLEYAKSAHQIIIQCQSKTEKLRSFLWDNGFDIYKEDLTSEKSKIYNAFAVRFDNKEHKYSTLDTIASKILVQEGHPLLEQYIKKHIKKLDDVITGLKKRNKPYVEQLQCIHELEGLYEKSIINKIY